MGRDGTGRDRRAELRQHPKIELLFQYQIPIFRIRQTHDLADIFRHRFGLQSLFDESKLNLKTFLAEDKLEPISALGPVRHHACITVRIRYVCSSVCGYSCTLGSFQVCKDYRVELNRFARPLREEVKPPEGQKVEFSADRPFFFTVYDVRAQLFLFMGRLMNPIEEEEADAWKD